MFLQNLIGGWLGTCFLCFHILGISSSQLTFIDFRGVETLVGGFKHFLFSISYMGCHPRPIDEVHHFSRCLKHVKTTNQIIS